MRLFITRYTPIWFQNVAISIYNTYQYRVRHGGQYSYYREYYKRFDELSYSEVTKEHKRRLKEFLDYAVIYSKWYKKHKDYQSLQDFPILEKESVIKNLDEITTINEEDAYVSRTGGTTGASMKVLYRKNNTQERHALLDHFRAQYGYSLGKKCAWFSGKNIVTDKDISKGVCYRDDYINKIRFFSTFRITENNFNVYWNAFCKFAPEYMVGFPSSIYELCLMASKRGLSLKGVVKTYFPTAETVLPIHREVISTVLGCTIADQYASSEGAPFILQCKKGRMHIHPLSGVFEVVNDDLQPSITGQLLVTSFTTQGTPLIRYRIGDSLTLDDENIQCECGSEFPLIKSIDGRSTDYIYSPTLGKVNLGNISNSTKGIKGIVQFQVHQDELSSVEVMIVCSSEFNYDEQSKFMLALNERFGNEMKISIKIVSEIAKESSGKFRIVKNNLL